MTNSVHALSAMSVVVAANNDAVLHSTLLRSPELRSISEVFIQREARSAGQAYNAALQTAQAELMIFAHQDVFLPDGWFKTVSQAAAALAHHDSQWAVLGVYGVCPSGAGAGHLYSTGLQAVLGHPFDQPVEVCSLDEVVLIVRRSSGLRFDAALPGFHLYGTDLCLEARRQGMKCYAISAFCLHNSNGVARLPLAYLQALIYLRRKWRTQLPLFTPCLTITRWGMPLLRHYLESLAGWLQNRRVGGRCADPAALYEQLLANNRRENLSTGVRADNPAPVALPKNEPRFSA